MVFIRLLFILSLICALHAPVALASQLLSSTVFYPFHERVLKEDYRNTIIALKKGDQIGFANGKVFVVERLLNDFEIGRANTAVVLLADGRVLRIPTMNTRFSRDFMKDYQRGHFLLKQNGVRVPELFDRGIDGQYVIVSYVPVIDRLSRWLKSPLGQDKRDAFLKFARETALFESIGDFGPDQVVWDGTHWVLLDWGGVSRLARPADERGFTDGADASQRQSFIELSNVIDEIAPLYLDNEQTLELFNEARFEIRKMRLELFSCAGPLSSH